MMMQVLERVRVVARLLEAAPEGKTRATATTKVRGQQGSQRRRCVERSMWQWDMVMTMRRRRMLVLVVVMMMQLLKGLREAEEAGPEEQEWSQTLQAVSTRLQQLTITSSSRMEEDDQPN